MLDTTTNTPALLPQQAAAPAYERCQVPSGSRHGPVWCVVAAKPKAERTAHAELHRRGFEAYLPLITTRWRDRTWHTGPLFTGYLFVRIRLDRPWNPITYCPGVFSLLFSGEKPGIVAEAVISVLRAGDALRASTTQAEVQWAPGMACRPRTGYISGMDAVVLKAGKRRAIIGVILAGSLHRVNIPVNSLETRGDN